MAKSSELQAAGRSQSASVLHPSSNNQTGVGTRYEVSRHTPILSRPSLVHVDMDLMSSSCVRILNILYASKFLFL